MVLMACAMNICLLGNEHYQTYGNPIDEADFESFMETADIQEEVAASSKRSKKSKNRADDSLYPIFEVTNENIQDLLNSPRPVIIDVYTDWCGPCNSFAPIYKDLNEEYGHLYQFAKLNGGKSKQLVEYFQIRGFPTILYIQNGIEVGRRLGFSGKDKFRSDLEKYFD